MVKVKPKAVREANFRRAIPGVANSYKAGIDGTTDWRTKAIEGQGLYVAKMQDSQVLERRRRGLEAVSDADWKSAALNKGVGRIAQGMEAGAAKQSANYEPIAQALEAVTLPARTADAVTNINNRVVPIVLAAQGASKKNR